MIPANSASGVLPPYVGAEPTTPANMSPYHTDILEIVQRYSFNKQRVEILQGLLNYRKDLAAKGLANGFQWLDGSFLEDCEAIRKRPPSDIDLVTFIRRPNNFHEDKDWRAFIQSNLDLVLTERTKPKYNCDAYLVDLNIEPEYIVDQSSYWYGFFSHQRDTFQWKGMLKVSTFDNAQDSSAQAYLDGVSFDD